MTGEIWGTWEDHERFGRLADKIRQKELVHFVREDRTAMDEKGPGKAEN